VKAYTICLTPSLNNLFFGSGIASAKTPGTPSNGLTWISREGKFGLTSSDIVVLLGVLVLDPGD